MKKFLLFPVLIILSCSSPFDLEVPPYPVEILVLNGFPIKTGDILTAHIPTLNEVQKKRMEIEYEWYRNDKLIIGRSAGGDNIAPVSKSDNTYIIFNGDSLDNMDTGSTIYVKAIFKYNESESEKITISPSFEGSWDNPDSDLIFTFNDKIFELINNYKGSFSYSDSKLILVFTDYYTKVAIGPDCDCETECECDPECDCENECECISECECDPECECEPDYEYLWQEFQPDEIMTATIDYVLTNSTLDLLNNTLEDEISINGSWIRNK